jgi:hypothetical protein
VEGVLCVDVGAMRSLQLGKKKKNSTTTAIGALRAAVFFFFLVLREFTNFPSFFVAGRIHISSCSPTPAPLLDFFPWCFSGA